MSTNEGDRVETERRSAGQAGRTTDPARADARAQERDLKTQEELDRRQKAIGVRRRRAGPRLEGAQRARIRTGGRPAAQPAAEGAEVPETDAADPP